MYLNAKKYFSFRINHLLGDQDNKFWPLNLGVRDYFLVILKTSRELRKAALRISHLLSRCQVVFTKRGTITTTVTTATITTITI